jgi:hypothetical protein
MAAGASAQQSTSVSVPGTPDSAPVTIVGCMMPGGGFTSMPGSGGSSGTGPAGMNSDAANSGVFFAIPLGKKKAKSDESSYSLVGVDPADMKKYAHKRVELQGVLLPPPNPAAADQTAAIATTKTDKAKPVTSQFRVTAIKQMPGSCGGR